MHGWVSHGFPNLFHLGQSQNTYSVNFTHILEEQGAHVAAVVAEAERRGGVPVEPTPEAEADWVATIHERALGGAFDFLAECTPGYFNAEGRIEKAPPFFGGGPIEFHALLEQWRNSGGMDQVLGTRSED